MSLAEKLHTRWRRFRDDIECGDLIGHAMDAQGRAAALNLDRACLTDYTFIWACYSAAWQQEELEGIVGRIRQETPDYDPSARFTLSRTIVNYAGIEADALVAELVHQDRATQYMRRFLRRHPHFDFQQTFTPFFLMQDRMSYDDVAAYVMPAKAVIFGKD